MEKKTLLIADDHPIFRQGLKQVAADVSWLHLVAEAETGDAALAQIRYVRPDIVMLDIAMPGMDGLKVLELSRDEEQLPLVVIVTSYDERAYMDRAFELGARGYVIKDSAAEDIVECLEVVSRGGIYVSPLLRSDKPRLPQLNNESGDWTNILTRAELTVLAKVAEFKTSKEIARELGLSYRTVQNHRTHICRKLELRGTHQLMTFAREQKEHLTF